MEEIINPSSLQARELAKNLYPYKEFLSCIYAMTMTRGERGDGKGYVFHIHNNLSHYKNATMSILVNGKETEVDYLTEVVDKLYSRLYYLAVLSDPNRWYLMSCEVHGRTVQFGFIIRHYFQGRCEMDIYINGINLNKSKNPMMKYLRYLAGINSRQYLLHSSYDGYLDLHSKQTTFHVSVGGLRGWNVGVLLYADTYARIRQMYFEMFSRRKSVPLYDASKALILTCDGNAALSNESAKFEFPFL